MNNNNNSGSSGIPQKNNGIGCIAIIIGIIATLSLQCVWYNYKSNNVRVAHKKLGHIEIIAGKSGELYNPISWFYSWPHAIWFYDSKKYHVNKMTAVFTVWTMATDDNFGGEKEVITRISDDGNLEMRYGKDSESKWYKIPNDEHLTKELKAILSK